MLNKNLKRIREQRKYSKLQLAKLSGVSRKTIEIIENKNCMSTTLNTIEKLATALGVTIQDLIK